MFALLLFLHIFCSVILLSFQHIPPANPSLSLRDVGGWFGVQPPTSPGGQFGIYLFILTLTTLLVTSVPPLTQPRPGPPLCPRRHHILNDRERNSSPSAPPCRLTCNTLSTRVCVCVCNNNVANTITNRMVLPTVAIMATSLHPHLSRHRPGALTLKPLGSAASLGGTGPVGPDDAVSPLTLSYAATTRILFCCERP